MRGSGQALVDGAAERAFDIVARCDLDLHVATLGAFLGRSRWVTRQGQR